MTTEATPGALGSNAELGVIALAVMRALAERAAAGKSTTVAHDWGFGSATLIDEEGAHTHVGGDWYDDDAAAFAAFVRGMHGSLCGGGGLSWVTPNARGQAGAEAAGRSGSPGPKC